MSEGRTVVRAGTLALMLWAGQPPTVVGQSEAAVTEAPATRGFEYVVPADAVAFVGVPDVQQLADGFASSPWGQLLADPAFDGLRSRVEDWAKTAGYQELASGFEGGIAAAILLDGPRPHGIEAFDGVKFSLLLLVELAEDHDSLDLMVQRAFRDTEEPGKCTMSFDIGRWHVMELHNTPPNEDDFVGRMVVEDRLLVFEGAALGANAMIPLLERLDAADSKGSLGELPRFRSSLASRPAGVQVWMNFDRIRTWSQAFIENVGAVETDTGRRLVAFVPRSGLLGLEDLSASLSRDAKGTRLDLSVRWPPGGCVREALQCLWAPGDLDARLAAFPANVSGVSTCRLDLGRLFDVVVRELMAAELVKPADVAATLASFEDAAGISLRDELLEELSGEVVAAHCRADLLDSRPSLPGLPYETVVLLGLRDGASFGPLLERLVRSRGLHAARDRFEIEGVEAFRVPLDFRPLFSTSLDYAVLPDMLVVSLNPTLFRETIRRYAGKSAGLSRLSDRTGLIEGVPGRGGLLEQSNAGFWTHLVATRALALFAPETTLPEMGVFERHLQGLLRSSVTMDATGLQLAITAP